MKNKNPLFLVSTFIILLIHVSGSIAMEEYGKFLNYNLGNILITLFLILINYPAEKRKLLSFMILIGILGFFVEWLGVNFGIIFGDYYYTGRFGLMVFGVPVGIGLFWANLIICFTVIINLIVYKIIPRKFYTLHLNIYFIIPLLVACFITCYDYYFIEPIAKKLSWWTWLGDAYDAPIKNYTSWFLVGFVFSIIFQLFNLPKLMLFAWSVLIAQIAFFLIIMM